MPDLVLLAPITALEPIAGAGLAINVAYLALNRFRYRAEIEPAAERTCSQNEEQTFDGFHDLDAVKELKWLARREKSEVFVPRGKGALAYRYVFRKHQDVALCLVAAFVCLFTLTTGVALAVGRWEWAKTLLLPGIPGILFYGCLLSMLVPAVLVPLGRKCAAWGKKRIEYCSKQVAISLGNLAQAARLPEGLEPPALSPGRFVHEPAHGSRQALVVVPSLAGPKKPEPKPKPAAKKPAKKPPAKRASPRPRRKRGGQGRAKPQGNK